MDGSFGWFILYLVLFFVGVFMVTYNIQVMNARNATRRHHWMCFVGAVILILAVLFAGMGPLDFMKGVQ